MDSFANILVLVGALTLVLALDPVNQLRRRLPHGNCRMAWIFLSGLIVFFFIGYLCYAYWFWGATRHWSEMVVPAIFFLGAVFVFIVCSLSAKTADDVLRLCRLEHENITDPLMGIYNRRHLDRCLQEEVLKAKRYGFDLAVMMIDVDHFKQVNDTHGHSVGDQVLQSLAQFIQGNMRDFDRVFRFGGEEIVVLLPCTGVEGALELSTRLCHLVSKHSLIDHEDKALSITISIGVSCYCPDLEDEASAMMARADEALYRAKKNGRDRVEVSPGLCMALKRVPEVVA